MDRPFLRQDQLWHGENPVIDRAMMQPTSASSGGTVELPSWFQGIRLKDVKVSFQFPIDLHS
jgi:hypothetical protein